MTPKLGLIGFEDTSKAQFDRPEGFECLVTFSSRFDRLCRLPLDQKRHPRSSVDLGKARSGGSATDAFAFWDWLDPPMRARVVAAGFGDYAAGLRRIQPRFSPAMRYALMERWNDCTHTFVFGFGEMTLTPMDYAAIIGSALSVRFPHWMLGTRRLL
ncbi:hypothetical protein JCGZ_19666 [Jatropha curcas]|uniref:Aminotransferase-like plant mobile domain-containing protein n=1 Tax=Jatropha curcas TaxID=180498 RepID=A0A067K9H8_JATCU|nr:hypothetical protein JCGZ_19666 [Jatropha curcas]